ncbi:hypothetical protein P0136_11405 [Lentisphaerota bacterium ZTH]|nr:hypothetical protein JYG24_11075 [Lentisphaerota bacterium]WET05964.1 hypothetical protein P0136_11405 [Lentisphaerota bacterium ZTH]
MKKKFLIIIASATGFLMTGCSTPQVDTSGKAVLINGYSAVNLIDSGLNPVTGTVTPSVTCIISSGMYSGIPVSAQAKDYLHYSATSSSSVWNTRSISTMQTLIFASSDRKLMRQAVSALHHHITHINEAAKSGN